MTRAGPNGSVAVTGMGVVCSLGRGLEAFTDGLREGRSGVEWVSAREEGVGSPEARIRDWDFAAALEGLGGLPAELRRRARRTASRGAFPVQVAVVAALEAWLDAGLAEAAPPADEIALVVAGQNLTNNVIEGMRSKFEKHPTYLPPTYALMSLDTDHVGSLSQVLGVRGEGYTVGGASAGGSVALVDACRLIRSRDARACLVCGALSDLSPMDKQGYLNVGAMAACRTDGPADAVCRPFDEGCRGFVYGQGVACLVLESEASARARGARILAYLRGASLRLSGNRLADPCEQDEARVMVDAMARAGSSAEQVSYVSAHGTGSALGDRVELRACRRAFGPHFGRPWINATKSLTGHCLSAAGVIEAVATIVQMRAGFVHPNVNLEHPIDPAFRFAGARSEPADLRFALSNSFGFGGFNSAIVFERAGGP